jgi:hypothetical protein
MNAYKNDSIMILVKNILTQMDNEFLIDELLKAYWKHPELLNHTETWKRVLEIQNNF